MDGTAQPGLFDRVLVEDGYEPGDVVSVVVRGNNEIEQSWWSDELLEVPKDRLVWTTVNEDMLPVRCLEQNRIALADVEDADNELTATRLGPIDQLKEEASHYNEETNRPSLCRLPL
jgi:hypothetical protein